jgi:hypothetical protein
MMPTDFTSREYYGAYYVEMDYTEEYAGVVYDKGAFGTRFCQEEL